MENSPSDSCDLCGLSLRHHSYQYSVADQTYHFCCRGCQQVFRILMEASESPRPNDFRSSELFKKCQDLGLIPSSQADLIEKKSDGATLPPRVDAAGSAQSHHHVENHANQLTFHLKISGMWCPACAWLIEETLKKDSGVFQAACYFSTDRVRCEYDPVQTSPDKIIASIHQLGYAATLGDDVTDSIWKKKEFIRFIVTAFLTANIMMLSFALYSGFLTQLTQLDIRMISGPIFVMAAVVFFYGGSRIHRRAFFGLTQIAFGMETLISVGSAVAFFYSVYNFMQGGLHLYFDTAAMLITLTLLGKTIESGAKEAVVKDLDTFFSLRPKKVRLCSDNDSLGRYVSADHLAPGDTFRLEADEVAAADGIVLEGAATLDESTLTGEARPVEKKPGDTVRSGSTAIKGQLKINARRVGPESILGEMIAIMETTLEQRTLLEGKTDRLLQWFVPGIIILAILTGAVWFVLGVGAETAIIRAVTVLVISCPCALGIAIPLTRIAGIAVATRQGILIRDFSCFERTSSIDHFVFDKTGTLTHGQWELVDLVPMGSLSKSEILAMAAGLEAGCDHYIAMAIRRYAQTMQVAPKTMDLVEPYENGVAGEVNGTKVRIGSQAFALSDASIDQEAEKPLEDVKDEYTSRVYLAVNDEAVALFKFGDQIKPGAKEMIATLHDRGYATSLVSGDEDSTTRFIGHAIGIDEATGGMLPTAKADFVQQLKHRGRTVAMVGDGINDAPALAQSDLALAVHGRHLLGKEVADVSLMRGDPEQILDFFQLAGKINRKINQNFSGAFVYNLISIPIAMSGMLNPLVAVCAMLLSSLSVIGNTLLLTKRKAP